MASKLGGAAQFTYDFGIMIAQSTVSNVVKLTGATLTLAGAFYTLQNTGEKYAATLKKNQLRFGGMVATMRQMQAAQDRLIKGISFDSVDDQLDAMNNLMAAGIKVGKNFQWISKAAHASGQSVAQFSGAIRSAVGGNMGQLVDMGLITERATRMFDKFGSNTVMRQQAIMSFLQKNKAIANAIKNDFNTIGNEMMRIKAIITDVFLNIAGKPNDPESWYHSVVASLSSISDAFARNIQMIRNYAKGISIVLGYFARQVGKVVVWLGGVCKQVTQMLLGSSDMFVERMRAFVVWLEFWKLYIIDALKTAWKWMLDFYHSHEKLINVIGKVLIAYLAWNVAWKVITAGTFALQGMIFGVRALRGSIIAAGGAWTYFSKMMTVGMFKGAKNRSFFRLFGMTPYKVNAWFLNLGYMASNAFSKGFAFVKMAMVQTWGASMTLMSIMWRGLISFMTATIKLPFVAMSKWFKFSLLLWNKPMGAIKMIGNGLMWLINLVPKFFGLMRAGFAAINASNPVGWIILGITLVVILYKKFKWFSDFVHFAIALFINDIKIVWNLINWVWVLLQVGVKWLWKALVAEYNFLVKAVKWVWKGIKTTWNFLSSTIFKPITTFFNKVVGWIGKMWKAFMNTAVGKFIDKYIVQPIKWVIDNLGSVIGKIVELLGGSANDFAKSQGVSSFGITTATTGQDVGNTINGFSSSVAGIMSSSPSLSTPDVRGALNMDLSNYQGVGTPQYANAAPITNNNTMTVASGAVQINITNTGNGEIDEEKLARQVRSILSDWERDYRVRGGSMKS